jgi:hypothetical protein
MARKRVWPWLVGLFCAGLAFLAAAYLVVVWIPAAAIQRHTDEVRAKVAAICVRGSRPPVLDGPLPGDAWDVYQSLMSSLSRLPEEERSDLDSLHFYGPKATSPDRLRKVLANRAPEIGLLRRSLRMGARLRESRDSKQPASKYFPEEVPGYEAIEAYLILANGLCWDGQRRESLECFLACMAMSQDILAAGYEMNEDFRRSEDRISELLKAIFGACDFKPEDLELFALGLDRLDAHRSTVTDFLAVQEFRERRSVLYAIAGRPNRFDGFNFNSRQGSLFPRSWQTLYLQRLAQVRTLNAVRDFYAPLSTIDQIPSWQRGDLIENTGRSWTFKAAVTCPKSYKILGVGHYQSAVDLQRLMIRVATALARYRTATGALPKSLSDLVPRYLAAVPVSPVTGEPLLYADGVLIAREPAGWNLSEGGAEWALKRP